MKTISNPLRVAALLLAPLLLPAGSVTAATIFDNGAADGVSGRASSIPFNQQSADDFLLQAGGATITDVHWTGTYFDGSGGNASPDADVFSISIFEDDGTGTLPQDNSLVDAVLGTVARAVTSDVFGLPAYTYSVDIDPIPLTAGVTYWLSILNNTTTNNAGFDWFWATSDANTGTAVQRQTSPETAWVGVDQELAFSLTDDNVPSGGAPLPGSLLLMLPGLLLLRRYAMR